MTISIVIPVLHAERTLARCLHAILCQASPCPFQLILVDNGSRDDSVAIATRFMGEHPDLDAVLLHEPQPGASSARNTGAGVATGDWLVFTDADCVPSETWLQDLAAAMVCADDRIGALAGCVHAATTEGVVAKFVGLYTLPPTLQEKVYSSFQMDGIGGFPTANLAVRKAVFTEIGGFDVSRRIYGEDHDLCRRIYARGLCIKALDNAVVRHIHRDHLGSMMRQARGFGTAHAWKLATASTGALMVHAPCLAIHREHPRLRVWIDINQADKKCAGVLLAALFWEPLLLLLPLYLCYLSISIGQRIRERGLVWRWYDLVIMPFLMIMKSGAMTWGRISGSIEHKVVCI